MIFNDEITQQSLDYVFNKLIPRIQLHVDETGHIWNLNTSCHECLSVRQAYISNIMVIKGNELEKNGCSFENTINSISIEQAFNSEFFRKLSD